MQEKEIFLVVPITPARLSGAISEWLRNRGPAVKCYALWVGYLEGYPPKFLPSKNLGGSDNCSRSFFASLELSGNYRE